MSEGESFHDRIPTLAEEASEARATFDTPADPPDEERAMEILREGAGPAVSLFVEARTGGHMTYFPPAEYRDLETAMNEYLDLYAACYGVDLEGEFQLREAAELLVDTNNIKDTAQILTGVPERGAHDGPRGES